MNRHDHQEQLSLPCWGIFTERTDVTDDELAKNENVKGAICKHWVENIKNKAAVSEVTIYVKLYVTIVTTVTEYLTSSCSYSKSAKTFSGIPAHFIQSGQRSQ